jgi:exopolysaccharide biosynthesis protein
MGLASQDLATSGGKTLTAALEAEANAVAAINAGAFQVDEASGRAVAAGLIYSAGQKSWDDNHNLVDNKGFAGFNQDGVLIVATSMTAAEAEVQGVRDGCSFGPVLIVNGEVNADAYNTNSGYASRTAIGQRADGTVIFVTIDGLQAGSLGANYQDLIDILMEYGAVNACNMNGGSSVMMYRDAGQIRMINNQSLLNTQESSMPNYWMVRATGKE